MNALTAPSHRPSLPADGAALTAAFETSGEGLVVVGGDGRIRRANAAARRFLELGDTLPAHLPAQLASLAISGEEGPQVQASGTGYRVRAQALEGGGAVLVLTEPESEYLSLFDNAVYGIYRDTLEGVPKRCNPALARLNGYRSEAEYFGARKLRHGKWYVDPARAAQFRRLLDSTGRVRDLVSEVYRHRTRERIWISEDAWYVRDAGGKPLFIEGMIQDVTARVTTIAAIERQANTDTLTGAASRFCFLNRLKAETAPEKSGCVIFIVDLDHFKEVNDALGHGAGDIVLKTAAERLRVIAGATGVVARLGGDEFAILQSGLHCHFRADATALAIVKALRQPVIVEGRGVSIGGSVGAAVYPAHASNADELLTHADLALYRVKASGRDGFRIFDHELKTNRERRVVLETELKTAISADELELYYQPIVSAASSETIGFEALMRWNHPRLGFLPPSEFIPVAEEAGLMTDLGNWAIGRACEQAAALPQPLFVSVNVSPTQFRSSGILAMVRQALAETGLDPARLMLEVTETAIITGESTAEANIAQLQAIGVQFALDDFGTGYSSLSYLQRFRFSKVKIDRSFVAGITRDKANLAIIRATIALCNDLEIDVVAEGIETPEQAETIAKLGGQSLQGYLFGKPRPFRDAMADLAVRRLPRLIGGSAMSCFEKRTVHNGL